MSGDIEWGLGEVGEKVERSRMNADAFIEEATQDLEDRIVLRISRLVETEMARIQRDAKAHHGLMLLKMRDVLETMFAHIECIVKRRYFSASVERSTEDLESSIFESSKDSSAMEDAKKDHNQRMNTLNDSLDSVNWMINFLKNQEKEEKRMTETN